MLSKKTKTRDDVRAILTIITLFALWLLMSGVYKPLIVWLGFFSSVFAVYMMRRMDQAADAETMTIRLKPFQMLKYLFWLLVEIAKSNWAVTKTILAPAMPINQHMFDVPFTQSTDLGQTIFANSITLTPGTITVDVNEHNFLVHALQYSDDDPAAIGDMDARVTKTEAVK
ncbi:Na+/H+ antiporter subunit E [Paramylibacter ulvae]|uniref:Na+/H+ antiporter subunit E n=1 Tax=Paramylibacter ulvae TaxID=1651968 RepID=UPI001672A9EF|nr:Na+/H+ antiporter subunit E [Amylibacter ulvae]